jgi:hypothetical protein
MFVGKAGAYPKKRDERKKEREKKERKRCEVER